MTQVLKLDLSFSSHRTNTRATFEASADVLDALVFHDNRLYRRVLQAHSTVAVPNAHTHTQGTYDIQNLALSLRALILQPPFSRGPLNC